MKMKKVMSSGVGSKLKWGLDFLKNLDKQKKKEKKKCFGLVMSNFPFSRSNAYDVSRLTFKYNF